MCAAAGGLVPTLAPADRQRLAGDHSGSAVSDLHRIGIHHPRHHLSIGVDIGGGDVAVRSDQNRQLAGKAPSHPLQLAAGHLLRIADHAALRATVGDVHYRAFPGHPGRQRLHLIQADVGVVADSTLRRSEGKAVLDPISLEDANRAIVHSGGNADDQTALRLDENLPNAGVELEVFRRSGELLVGDMERIEVFHRISAPRSPMMLLGGRRLATSGPQVGGACELPEESAGQRSDLTWKGQGQRFAKLYFGSMIARLVALTPYLRSATS